MKFLAKRVGSILLTTVSVSVKMLKLSQEALSSKHPADKRTDVAYKFDWATADKTSNTTLSFQVMNRCFAPPTNLSQLVLALRRSSP